MDGEATDFVIDDDGNLVPVAEEEDWEHAVPLTVTATALAVMTQYRHGPLVLAVYGTPSPEMQDVLEAALQRMVLEMTQH